MAASKTGKDGRSARPRQGAGTRRRADLVALALAATLAVASLASLVASLAPRSVAPAPKESAQTSGAAGVQADAGSEGAASGQDAQDAAREEFVSVWAARIDAFDAGYPLEGYGRTFAEAAYDCGVDPRFAPAIARVESGSGTACTYPCNAWGWGTSSWGDWDTAIWEYTAALASSYGGGLSYEAALSYNEETPDAWYAEVEAAMYQIWETDGL